MSKTAKIFLLLCFLFAVSGVHDLHCEHCGHESDQSCAFAFLTQGHYVAFDADLFESGIYFSAERASVIPGQAPDLDDYTYSRTLRSPPFA